jgi:predicted PurR-regulated permease PerM
VTPERVVVFRPRAILSAIAVILAVAVTISVLWIARVAVTWVLISLFLALALNPAVEWLQHRRGLHRRGAATTAVYVVALLLFLGALALIVPTIVSQTSDLIDAAPGYVNDFTKGKGPLGFLETKYDLTERVRQALQGGGGGNGGKAASTALDVGRGLATGIAGLITIIFMTLFMLLEGPSWIERILGVLPERSRERWHDVGHEIYRTIGGYVSGNLLISLIAGVATTIVLLIMGVPYAVALGLVVAVLDLVPLAGATVAAVIVTLVAFTDSVTAGIVVAVFFLLYQQAENHILQPVVYGRTVQLSPLAVLIAILIGVELAGILGALGAIPVAGTLQILIRDWQRQRVLRAAGGDAEEAVEDPPPGGRVTAPAGATAAL